MELTRNQKRLLHNSFLLDCVPGEAVEWLGQRGSLERTEKGTQLYAPDLFRRSLALILSGRVCVTRGELFVANLEPGDWFGAAALFQSREDYPATLTALSACEVIFFSQETVQELMRCWPQTAVNYICYLSGRIHFLSDRLNSLAPGLAEEKVEKFLLQKADETGSVCVSAAEMARTLGLGRASIYRAFEALEMHGVITREGKTVRINMSKGKGEVL